MICCVTSASGRCDAARLSATLMMWIAELRLDEVADLSRAAFSKASLRRTPAPSGPCRRSSRSPPFVLLTSSSEYFVGERREVAAGLHLLEQVLGLLLHLPRSSFALGLQQDVRGAHLVPESRYCWRLALCIWLDFRRRRRDRLRGAPGCRSAGSAPCASRRCDSCSLFALKCWAVSASVAVRPALNASACEGDDLELHLLVAAPVFRFHVTVRATEPPSP